MPEPGTCSIGPNRAPAPTLPHVGLLDQKPVVHSHNLLTSTTWMEVGYASETSAALPKFLSASAK
jgi:hypothetical protein